MIRGLVLYAVFVGCTAPASAQGRLEAQYEASLAGIPVGRGAWTIDISDDQYSAAARGGSSGLLNVFANASGSGAAQGRIVNGQLAPQSYTATTTSSRKSETIRLALSGGAIKELTIEPDPPVDPHRIPVTDAQKRNVLDPMTGSLLRASGSGDPLSPDTCRGTTPIFDGRMRYDLKLEFKRMETVRADKGYRGPAVVCGVTFAPLSGYIADRPAIKYLIAQRHMEAWFVPIAGTRVMVPFRVMVPTPFGQAVLEARQFVTSASPAKSAARTQ